MTKSARVIIIGGGIAGCSTLYHLTQEGWSDVILLERDELTSGTTWHSAAQVTNFGMTQTMIGLKSHSIALYQELAADADYPINYHHGCGGIRLANDERVMEGYRHFASMAKGMGVEFEIIDADECVRRHPLLSSQQLIGGLWDPHDGDIDPAQLCQALARRARKAGAEVIRHTAVTGLAQHDDDSWTVCTDSNVFHADIVVNAAGYRVNEVGAMMGVEHPVISMEHQYFLTEPMQDILQGGYGLTQKRLPLIRCPISDFYCRQEKQGLLIGFYEQACKTWGMDGIDPAFTNALCPDDPDRVLEVFEGAIMRMPALAEAGLHTIINGPITYSADGSPLVGPIPERRNAYCIVGLRAGVGEGGGHGWLLAQQIVHGEACYDTWPLDPRRFGTHADANHTALKAIEDYQNEFRFHFPHEHRPAARWAKTTPLTEDLSKRGAVFAPINGWERVDYVAPDPTFQDTHSFRFNETFDIIKREVEAVSEAVALSEINGFTRYEITGTGIHEWLDSLSCTPIKPKLGRVGLAYFLNAQGCIKMEGTLATLPNGRVWYGSAAAADRHDMDWLQSHLPHKSDIAIRRLTDDWCCLLLAGPKSRQILARIASGDWSNEAFPWLSVTTCHIDSGEAKAAATVMRVSYSGALAYELHVPINDLPVAYEAIRKASHEMIGCDIPLFGLRAIESMRIEMGYLHWKADLITEFDPFETGIARFVKLNKGNFIGREALLAHQARGARRRLICLEIAASHAPAHSGASVMSPNGKIIGTVTSAAWGYRTAKNLAYAFVKPEYAANGSAVHIDIVGQPYSATVVSMGVWPSS